jgi:hypothetical protein
LAVVVVVTAGWLELLAVLAVVAAVVKRATHQE